MLENGIKHCRMAITSILYNECLRRRCVTKKVNVAQVEFYNNRLCGPLVLCLIYADTLNKKLLIWQVEAALAFNTKETCISLLCWNA